jgi:HlyD family secretion protein
MKIDSRMLLFPALVLLAAACGGSRDGLVEVPGYVEAVELRLSFRAGGLLQSRMVEEGDRIGAGDTIATLDPAPFEVELDLREAELAAAEARLGGFEEGSRPQEIGRAASAAGQARAVLDQARANSARMDELYAAEAVSRQDWETARTALAVAQAGYDSAAELLSLVFEGARDSEIAAAAAAVEAAAAGTDQARMRLGYATLASPAGGVVLSVHAEPGENVAQGAPVVTLGLVDTVKVICWVTETDLASIAPGQPAEIAVDGEDGAMPGRVASIADEAEFTPSTVETREERVSLVYRVVLLAPNPGFVLKPGMPVDAVILTGGQ